MPVKAFYRKIPVPVDPEAAGTPDPVDGEEPEVRPASPEPEEPICIGGGVLSLSQVLWPLVASFPEDFLQEGSLPTLPPTSSIQPAHLVLAPYSSWSEPDVQVPLAPAAKSLSDVSASVVMDVCLWGREAELEEDAGAS